MPRTRSIAWAELKLGVVGFVALVLVTVLILAVGGQGGFFWQRYPLRARFDDVAGLKSGAIVRLNGMEVGKVTGVELVGAQVEVVMEVAKSVRPLITTESEAAMGTLSLLGEPIIVIRASATGAPLEDDAYLSVGGGGGIAELASSASRSAKEMGRLVSDVRAGQGSVGRLFTDEALYDDLEALAASAARIARGMDEGGGTLGALARDPTAYVALRGALENLQALTAGIRGGGGALGRMATDDALGSSLAGATANLEAITGRLSRGEGTAGRLLADTALYDRIDGLTGRLDRILGALEGERGTAGRILSDPRLYENVNQAAAELQALIAEVRKDPKRYLGVSFSVF
jgi:phospholipid/cholesterol/gamma-HCH transport system substrate-binding protein